MSSPRSTKKADIEDLSTRARRIGLSADEQRQFDRACEASPALRIAHQVGCDFDRIGSVRAGDEELITRIADRVLLPEAANAEKVRRRLVWGVGVAAALVSSAAAAWWTAVAQPSVAQVTEEVSGEPAASSRTGGQRAWRARGQDHGREVAERGLEPAAPPIEPPTEAPPRTGPQVPPVTDEPRSTSVAPRREPRGSGSPPSAKSASRLETPNGGAASGSGKPEGDTAANWFRRANAARRAGDFAAADTLYNELETRFPSSDEARLSHVSLGRLLLASRRALEAEHQFSLYLSEGGRELAEEALVGRAESLERLGRHAEERQSWERLSRDFPASVYASQAQRRLDELRALAP